VLWAFLAGLIAFSALHVTLRGFYAMNDTRTPFLLQLGQSVLFMATAVGIGVWVDPQWRAFGLALAISAFGTLQTVVAIAIMRRRLQGLRIGSLLGQLVWFVAAMIPAAGAGIGVLQLLGGTGDGAFPATGFVGPAVAMVLVGLTMLVVYGAVLVLTRNPVARELLGSLRGRGVGSEPPVE
jgi:putative peptidoglycan lipid II flippase